MISKIKNYPDERRPFLVASVLVIIVTIIIVILLFYSVGKESLDVNLSNGKRTGEELFNTFSYIRVLSSDGKRELTHLGLKRVPSDYEEKLGPTSKDDGMLGAAIRQVGKSRSLEITNNTEENKLWYYLEDLVPPEAIDNQVTVQVRYQVTDGSSLIIVVTDTYRSRIIWRKDSNKTKIGYREILSWGEPDEREIDVREIN